MNIPPEFQDTKYHLSKLTETFAVYKGWLKSLDVLPTSELEEMADRIIKIASDQAHLSQETAYQFAELCPQPPQGIEPDAWRDLTAKLREQSNLAQELFFAARKLHDYMRDRH